MADLLYPDLAQDFVAVAVLVTLIGGWLGYLQYTARSARRRAPTGRVFGR